MGSGADGASPDARLTGISADARLAGAEVRPPGNAMEADEGNTVVPGFDRRARSGLVTIVGAIGPWKTLALAPLDRRGALTGDDTRCGVVRARSIIFGGAIWRSSATRVRIAGSDG